MRALIGTCLLAASLLAGGATAATAQANPTPLGPDGYGPVKIGMSLKKAKATGVIVPDESTKDYCTYWHFKKFGKPKGDSWHVIISKKRGVVVIQAQKGMKTPEGITFGSTFKRLQAAYPRLEKDFHGFYVTDVPGNKKALYRFAVTKGKVTQFYIEHKKQDCIN